MLYFNDNYDVVVFSKEDEKALKKKKRKEFWKKHKKGIVTAMAVGIPAAALTAVGAGLGISSAIKNKQLAQTISAERDKQRTKDLLNKQGFETTTADDYIHGRVGKSADVIQMENDAAKRFVKDHGFEEHTADDYIHGRVKPSIEQQIATLKASARDKADEVADEKKKRILDAYDNTHLTKAVNNLKDKTKYYWDDAKNQVKNFFKGVADKTKTTYGNAKEDIQSMINAVKSGNKDTQAKLNSAESDYLKALELQYQDQYNKDLLADAERDKQKQYKDWEKKEYERQKNYEKNKKSARL